MLRPVHKQSRAGAIDYLRYFWKAGYVGAALMCLSIVVVIWTFQYGAALTKASDLKGAAVQKGTGVVTHQALEPMGRGTPRANIDLRMNGHEYHLDFDGFLPDLTQFLPGRQVRVEYRVGKSGQVYIEGVQPFLTNKLTGAIDTHGL